MLRVTFSVIIFFFEGKAQQYFVSSSNMFLNKETLLKIGLNPGLNLSVFQGTGPRAIRFDCIQGTKWILFNTKVIEE